MSALSAKYVVLGLLIELERPGYGYELQQRLESRVGFLRLSEGAVYKILQRLEHEGWIEEAGTKNVGGTRRGAPRVMYRETDLGRERFKEWIRTPSKRGVLRDVLHAKLSVSRPEDLPEILAVAERQHRETLADLATMRRPTLAQVADPEVPWRDCGALMLDDLTIIWLKGLVDWLDRICALIEERIERTARIPLRSC